jgi:FixJ family two-component response regulator
LDIPAIIVSAPSCPQEFRDYLAAMNLGTLEFLCYPYQKSEFERVLESAISVHSRPARQNDTENEFNYRERGAA